MDSRVAVLLIAAFTASCGALSPSADDMRDDPHGHLVWAARKGDVAAIRTLAASGIDLNASTNTPLAFVFPDFDHKEWTALQHAVQKQQVEAVRVLLESGAKPDARPEGSAVTPLFIAIHHEDLTIARLLVKAGADVALSRQAFTADEPGGPLWNAFEHAMERVTGHSREDALTRLSAFPTPQAP